MLITRLFNNQRRCNPHDDIKILLMQECLNEGFHSLHKILLEPQSGRRIRQGRWRIWERCKLNKTLPRQRKEKELLRRPGNRWEDKIKRALKEGKGTGKADWLRYEGI